MNQRPWWAEFIFRRLWDSSITIEADDEEHFWFWLKNYDGEHIYEPHQLRDQTRRIYVTVSNEWAAPLRDKLIIGLPIYDEVKWHDEQTKTHRKEWVKRETPIDLAGYIAEYGHKITIARTGEKLLIVSTHPLTLPNVVVQ